MPQPRFDIQFLRGLAVLLVVVFHAFPDVADRGFLGVDIFFVISGFLITGIILRGLETGSFSFANFYLRRAKRLLPAAYSTFIVTTLLAYLVLTRQQWGEFLRQVVGAVTFTANFILYNQSGYFEAEAETKPLLHIWSLSLEEQFYFVAPILLWVVSARHRFPLLVAGLFLSLALCFWLASGLPVPGLSRPVEERQSLAFFMLPPRAWELLLGSLCAWLMLRRPDLNPSAAIKWLALLILMITCVIGIDDVHPRLDALVVTLATGAMLLGRDGWLPHNRASRSVAAVGDWSYSLYLVHWPLFSFAYIAYVGAPPMPVMVMLGLTSIFLGYIQYRYVEIVFRDRWSWDARRAWISLGGATLLLPLACAPAAYASLLPPAAVYPERLLWANFGFAKACDQRGAIWRDIERCRTSSRPSVAVWGDSYAMHLVPGLAAEVAGRASIIQLTKSSCSPIPGIAQITREQSPEWAAACVSFNKSAFRKIISTPSIEWVIMSSPFFSTFLDLDQKLLVDGRVTGWSQIARERFGATLAALAQAGKKTVVVSALPREGFDPALCNLRRMEGLVVLGRSDCAIDLERITPESRQIMAALQSLSMENGGSFLYSPGVLCSDGTCPTKVGINLIYRDAGHMTKWGSRYFIRRSGLAEMVAKPTSPEAEMPSPP